MKSISNSDCAAIVRCLVLFADTPCDMRDYRGMNARGRARLLAKKLQRAKKV